MVTRHRTATRGDAQAESGTSRFVRITANTPHGTCSERLTAFGGLLALVKFLDLLKFEETFHHHYVVPKRAPKLGDYRMVLGLLLLLFIGFQRLGHFVYVRTDPMVCGVLRVHILPAVSTFWRYLMALKNWTAGSSAIARKIEITTHPTTPRVAQITHRTIVTPSAIPSTLSTVRGRTRIIRSGARSGAAMERSITNAPDGTSRNERPAQRGAQP